MWRTVDEEQLLAWGQQAGCILQKHGALRIGESSVASFHVHTIEPTKPGFVNILLGSDAGEVFYQRSMPGEIIHLDIFHSLGKVDHRKVAAGIKAFASVKLPETFARYPLLDYMDLQTGTGGGRVSGSLIFGMKESLQKAHMNHVHITVKIPHDLMGLLVPLVAIVEDEIMAHGYEVRRIEGLNFLRGRNKQPVDLSHYATQSDSFMQNQNQTVSLRSSEEQEQLETALDLAQKVMNPAELKDIFADFVAGRGQAPHAYAEEQQAMLKRMQELNLIRVRGGRYYLTSKGLKLKEFLGNHFAEVEFYFRKLLRKVPIGSKRSKDNHGSINLRGCAQGGKQKKVKPIDLKEPFGELAVPETMLAAAKRRLQLGNGNSIIIKQQDLRRLEKKPTKPLNICLLIDASASMAGERLQAAKYLAQHLLLSTKDRVAVIIFQDQQVKLAVPFTRNLVRVQQGLKDIKAYGLTPLSLGLEYTLKYLLEAKKEKECLFFVITDGIPTVSSSRQDPALDALEVAGKIARQGLHFGCIGLAPNKGYLKQLTERGKGNLYIIDELQGKVLAEILHQEIKRAERD